MGQWVRQAIDRIHGQETGETEMVEDTGTAGAGTEPPANGQRAYVIDSATGTYQLRQYSSANGSWEPIPETTMQPETVSQPESRDESTEAGEAGPDEAPADQGINNPMPEPAKRPVWVAVFPVMTADGHATQGYVYSDGSVRLTPDD